MENKERPEEYKIFLQEIVKKVKYYDYEFSLDSISYPTEEQVQMLKNVHTRYEHRISFNIAHYGPDNERGPKDEIHRLTYYGHVYIKEWTEKAVKEACFIALIKKLRHEASEVFKYDEEVPFHEHRTELISIPQ